MGFDSRTNQRTSYLGGALLLLLMLSTALPARAGIAEVDFGDAPDPTYATLAASGGPSHGVTGLTLGALIDADADGQPTATATGDDTDAGGDDEDGVTFPNPLVPGAATTVSVTASAPAILNYFFDFDGNGTFGNAANEIFVFMHPGGVADAPVTVPGGAAPGTTYARFRLSTMGVMGPGGGPAADGEVEDYAVTIETPPAMIKIVKTAIPFGDPQDFSFSGSGEIGDFDLDDDSDITLPNMVTFTPSAPGTYTVSEAGVPGWLLTGLSCSDPTEDSSTDIGGATATIELAAGETVTCTFTNTLAGKIIIDKVTEPAGDPTAFDFSLDVVEGANIDTFALADEDAPYMIFVEPGIYAVTETVPTGWELLNPPGICDGEGFADDISVSAGGTTTCTFLNRTTVESNLGFTKVFAPDTIGPGSTTTLTFTITNPDGIPAGLLTFSDDLPAGMTIAGFPNPTSTCGGTVVATPGGSSMSFSGGSVAGFGSCEVSVDVTSSTAGVSTNTSNPLTSTDGIATDDGFTLAMADLTVDTTLPGFSKSFAPATVALGGRSTLTFTIDNSANGSNVLNLDFTDNLPLGMEISDPANASTTCGTAVLPPTLTADAGSSTIILDANGTAAFPAVAASATCTVTVDVMATGAGMLGNVSEDLLASFVAAGKASATLEVTTNAIHLTKEFTDDPVPPGGTVTLEFTITNFDRIDSATAVAVTDDLTTLVPALAGLTFSSLLSNDCGGSVSGVGGTTIGLSGGTIAPEGTCTLRVSLSVPAGAAPGTYTNTTGAVSATVGGSPETGNLASDDLFVSPVPVLTKEFLEDGTLLPDPVVNPGDDVVLRFTITNTSTTSMATDVAFLDELTDGSSAFPPDTTSGFLPFPVTVTLPPVPNPPCGAGSSLALVTFPTERQRLELTGGSLAAAGMAGDSCTFEVTVTIPAGFAPGIYVNTTEEPTATVDGATRTGLPASDDLTVVAAPRLTKAFTDDPVAPGGTVTLEFTLDYPPDQTADATGISFTDDLTSLVPPLAGLTVSGLPLMEACDPDGPGGSPGTGTLSEAGGVLTFMGGVLQPGLSCAFSVTLDVPAGATAGSFTNTTSGVGATVGGIPATSQPAEDDLDINGLKFTKEFDPDVAIPGETVKLRFTIDNVHPTDDATITSFTDTLSAVLPGMPDLIATDPPTVDTCGGTPSGTTFLIYVGGSVLNGETCTVEWDVLVPVGAPDGTHINTSSSLSSSLGTIAPAVDELTVNSNLIGLTKEFTDDPVAAGDPVTLRFTLTNLDAGQAASGIAFSDDLGASLAGLTATGLPFAACGGTVAAIPDASTIDFSGGTLGVGASCFFDVSLTVPAMAVANIYTNTTSDVTGTIGGFAVTGDAASDELSVLELLLFSKSFDGPTVAGGTAVLTFTITNPGSLTATGIAFSDNLDDVIPGLVATGLPLNDVCGTGSQISGTSFLTFTGGSLPPKGGMCSFDVDVSVPATATAGAFPNTTSALSQNGLQVSDPATADLAVEPPPTFAKAFAPSTIGLGTVSTLTFTIDNTASAVAASNLDFTDNLPAGVVVVTPSVTANTCGGTLSATAGAGVISLTDGTVGATASCTIDVDVSSSTLGMHVNTTGDLTSSSGNSGTASATLTVIAPPTFAKEFSPDAIGSGGVSTLTFTIDNSASTVDATGLDFTDNLPADVTVASPSNASTTCTGGTLTSVGGSGVITYTGGTVSAASTCTVSVDVTSATPGAHVNLTGDLTSSLGSSGTATDTLNVSDLAFGKSFAPDVIGPGSTTLLQFDITNTSDTNLAENVMFSDTLPAGVVIATPSSAATDCTDGILSAPDGGTTISLTGARVGTLVSCSVTVNVIGPDPGSHDNVSGDLTSSLGNAGPATATLTVDAALPGFSKSFSPSPIPPGGTSTLTFTIDYTSFPGDDEAEVFGADGLEFTDILPGGVVIATPTNATTNCTGGFFPPTLTAVAGTDTIVLLNGFVASGSTCTVELDVTAAAAGTYDNVSGELLSGPSRERESSGFATARLEVVEQFLTKLFIDDPVAPGQVATLQFRIKNPSRDFPATDIEFTDTIDPLGALTGLLPAETLPKAACGGTLDFATGALTFSGGSLPAGGSCTFTIALAVPPTAVPGAYTNTTSSIMATVDGVTETGDPAVDTLFVEAFPILTKEFTDDPVGAGGTVTLEFSITNPSTTSMLSDISFSDEFATILQTSPSGPPAPGFCGPGSTASFTPLSDPPGGSVTPATLLVTGASLAPAGMTGDSCTFSIVLDVDLGAPAGIYPNTTSEITGILGGYGAPTAPGAGLTIGIAVTGPPATDDLVVVGGPRLTKEFTDDPVQPGGTVTLEFTLEHDAFAPGDATAITFTDDLAGVVPGLTATGLPLMDVCGSGNGTVTGSAGDTFLTFAGATLTPGTVCTFSVTLAVPADAPSGNHTNTTSNVVADVLGLMTIDNPAQDDLMIGGLVLTKEFTDDPVIAGGDVTLEFTIVNLTPDPISGISFDDPLDPDVLAGLTVVTPLPLVDPCGAGSQLDTDAGGDVLLFTGGSLGPTGPGEGDGVCTFSVTLNVPGATPSGTYPNRTENFGALLPPPPGGPVFLGESIPFVLFPNATDNLEVANEQLVLTKEFVDDPTVPGGTVTMEFTISSLQSDSASDLAFTDDLAAALPGLTIDSLDSDSCGGTLTGVGTSLFGYSGGGFAGGDCAISVTLQVPMAVPFGTTITNTTSEITGTIGGFGVTGAPASDDLMIDFFVFTKSFDGLTKPTGTPVLTFMIENLSTMDSVDLLSFSDDLDAVIPGLMASSLPMDPCGLGSSITGTSFLTMSGGNLLPGGMCTFSVDLLVPPDAGSGDFLNTTSDLFQAAVPAAAPATALLSVEPGPTLTKIFSPDVIVPGGRSALVFVIDNATVFPVTDLAFVDNLPAGMVVAPSADIGTTCVGATLVANEGSGVITFSNGELLPGEDCLIQVDVTSFTPGVHVNQTEPLTSSSGEGAKATDTLVVVSMGDCLAADGELLTIENDTFLDKHEFVVCDTITVGPNVGVLGPDGHLTLRAGVAVVFLNGVTIGVDGKLTVSIEPLLIP